MACFQNTRKNSIVWPRDTADDPASLLCLWGDRDDHMKTTNRPSRPDRLEIFWNDWGTIRTIIWKPGLKGVSCRFWFNKRCLGRTLFLPIQISPTVVLKEISIWKKKKKTSNKQTNGHTMLLYGRLTCYAQFGYLKQNTNWRSRKDSK